jgi:hypothetical protein
LACSEDVRGINSARSLANENEAIHDEYWPEHGDDKTRENHTPEAKTGSDMIEVGLEGY